MRSIYRYLTITVLAVILSGCLSQQQAPAPVEEESKPQTPTPPLVVPNVPDITSQGGLPEPTIPAVPKVRHYQWGSTMQPLMEKMLRSDGVTAGSVLLVDTVNNRTNGSLQTAAATEALVGALANNRTFTLVSEQQLAAAKQQLGLSAQDSLGSRSKALGIARQAGATYVLYSNVSGNVNAPTLRMQLMLVQTGEIIWSGDGAVQQSN